MANHLNEGSFCDPMVGKKKKDLKCLKMKRFHEAGEERDNNVSWCLHFLAKWNQKSYKWNLHRCCEKGALIR